MHIRICLRRFCEDEHGAVVIIVALLMTAFLGFVALGVDLSSLYFQQKTLQTRADLAAVSAVMNLHDQPEWHARTTIGGNGLDGDAMTGISYARYIRDVDLAPDDRLDDRNLTDNDVNAATVKLREAAPLYFARSFLSEDSTLLGATATAAQFNLASFSLGSRLLSLDGGLLNALLSAATGSTISMDVLDYQALADAQIDLLTFSDALATRAELTALTYEELLNSNIELLDVAGALLDTGAVTGTTAVLGAVLGARSSASFNASKLIAADGDNVAVQLGDILPNITVSALDLLMSSVDAINAGHFIEASINADVDGVIDANLVLAVGEHQAHSGWITLGEAGATLHTAQIRMKLDLNVEPDLLSGIATTLDIVSVELPIYIEVASATVTLTSLGCGASDDDDMIATFDTGISPLTGVTGTHVAELFLGRFDVPSFEDQTTPLDQGNLNHAKLLGLNIGIGGFSLFGLLNLKANVMIKAHAAIGISQQDQTVFSRAEEGTTKSFGSSALLSSGLRTLLANADVRLDVETGIINLGLITGILSTVLSNVFAVLDPVLSLLLGTLDSVLDKVLDTLGVGVGEADLTLHKVNCGPVMLVR